MALMQTSAFLNISLAFKIDMCSQQMFCVYGSKDHVSWLDTQTNALEPYQSRPSEV